MANQEKKAGDTSGSFLLLNQLITGLEEAELKLEEAYRKENPEGINMAKELILKIQKQIAEEVK
ncbi:MAG: hypothetical protein NTZ83_01565 [Candidatus Pacearchaeota archaeon]|nr:hypothetical protein [Candidatus Pacearchaeota archaeon]